MAIFHCSVKTVSRSKGASACASAAYRSGEKIIDAQTGITHDYSRKSDVGYKRLIGWNGTRSELWNCAEETDTRKNATTAREYEVAIPKEFDLADRQMVSEKFGEWLHETHGVAVDVCIHDIKGEHPHAHILTTTRKSLGDSLGEKVAREWSDTRRKKAGLPGRKKDLIDAREKWAEYCNYYLELYGKEKIDHRSYKAQGVDKTPQLKLGKATHHQYERTGFKNERYQRYEESKNTDAVFFVVGEIPNLDTLSTLDKVDKINEAMKLSPFDFKAGDVNLDSVKTKKGMMRAADRFSLIIRATKRAKEAMKAVLSSVLKPHKPKPAKEPKPDIRAELERQRLREIERQKLEKAEQQKQVKQQEIERQKLEKAEQQKQVKQQEIEAKKSIPPPEIKPPEPPKKRGR